MKTTKAVEECCKIVINPAAVKDDDDYRDLVKKFKFFLETGRKETAKIEKTTRKGSTKRRLSK